MKKTLIKLASFLLVASNLLAGGLGYVNTDEVLRNYPETQRTQTFLESKKAEMQDTLDQANKILLEKQKVMEAKGESLTEQEKSDFLKLQQTYKTQFEKMQYDLDSLQYNMFEKLKSDVSTAIKKAAKEKELDAVFDNSVIYYGGENITKDVIEFLSGSEKIEVE